MLSCIRIQVISGLPPRISSSELKYPCPGENAHPLSYCKSPSEYTAGSVGFDLRSVALGSILDLAVRVEPQVCSHEIAIWSLSCFFDASRALHGPTIAIFLCRRSLLCSHIRDLQWYIRISMSIRHLRVTGSVVNCWRRGWRRPGAGICGFFRVALSLTICGPWVCFRTVDCIRVRTCC